MARSPLVGRSGTKPSEPPYCPDTADIVRLDFDPQAGREQAGRRPALVLSPRRYNEFVRLCVVCPITNQAKGWRFEVALPDGHPVTGVVLADQVKSLSWTERRSEFVARCPPQVVAEVSAKIKPLLQIP
jgi:mRNA interferase MazF